MGNGNELFLVAGQVSIGFVNTDTGMRLRQRRETIFGYPVRWYFWAVREPWLALEPGSRPAGRSIESWREGIWCNSRGGIASWRNRSKQPRSCGAGLVGGL